MAKKCPLRQIRAAREGFQDSFGLCMRQECEWWGGDTCSITAIAKNLSLISAMGKTTIHLDQPFVGPGPCFSEEDIAGKTG